MPAESLVIELYKETFGHAPAQVTAIAGAGSNRCYFRMVAKDGSPAPASVIGTVGVNHAENAAFIALARHFTQQGLPVPEIIAVSPDGMCYLQSDLGDASLYSLISEDATNGHFTTESIALLEKSVEMLAQVQHYGARGLNWKLCSPEAMDSRMIRWDLNYFKYCFLKQTGLEFDEIKLEDEFERLHDTLMERVANATTFMIRDFQSRNVMISNGKPMLIDFQGGRRGPAEYDLASFLWQAKAHIPDNLRRHLTEHYLHAAIRINPEVNSKAFKTSLPYFVLFRILQTLGAYGFRGLSEGKAHFMSSIPQALSNLESHLREYNISTEFPYLHELTCRLHNTPVMTDLLTQARIKPFCGLTVTVGSFSYKRGLPKDFSGNGGGFVFDCRAVHNPGRYEQYKRLTGRDEPVKAFLEADGEITLFLNNAWGLTDASVERYLKRGFTSLSVNFGCTGGQHRSVYSAEATARHIAEKFPQTRVVLYHREQNILEIITPTT